MSALTTTNNNQPFILYAISNRPPGSLSSSSSNSSASGGGAKNSRDPIQIICPYTGSNLTSTHPLRTPTSSSNKNAFGIQCLLPVPVTNMMGSGLGGDDGNSLVFIGHGGSSTTNNKNGGKDDYAFLLSRLSSSSNNNNNNPKWKVRCPQPLSKTFQSISISSSGRYVAAGTTSGSILLWDWTLPHGDNLINVWKGHYRSITSVLFNEEGTMLFSGGDDGVVNAWNVLDLIDIDNSGGGSNSVHPFQTWSEHSLPITSLCVLSGSGSTTRLVSSSLDRNIILMELGCSGGGSGMSGTSNNNNGRTLARICLPSGIHTVITNNATASCCSQRLYCGAHDGNVYCIDLDKFALHETTTVVGTSSSYNSGTTTVVNVNQSGESSGTTTATRRRKMKNEEDNFESLLMGSHILLPSSSNNSNNNYTSELKGHLKAVTSLALLDPSSLLNNGGGGNATNVLLASGSDDGTLRIWDLNSRSCIKVLRPWSTTTSSSSSVGGVSSSSSSVSSSSSPPITGIIAVPKSSLSSSSCGNGINTTLVTTNSRSRRGGSNAHGSGDITSLFKPLKSFLRGTSVVQNSDTNDNVLTESGLGGKGECIAPILWPRRDDVQFWEEPIESSRSEQCNNNDDDGGYNTISRKRVKYNSDGVHVDDNHYGEDDDKKVQDEEIARLKKALAESQTVIKRWEAVNNQLITKLKNDNK